MSRSARAGYWFLIGFCLIVLCGPAMADKKNNRPPDNRPPDNRPPVRTNTDVTAAAAAGSISQSGAAAESAAGAMATGGAGGSAESLAAAAGGQGGAGGAGGTGGLAAADSGGNTFDGGSYRTDNESSYFALSVTAPNISGCIAGGSVGGGGDGGGGLFQWNKLNHDCFINEMADAERHIGTRARLKCASKHWRNAVTFDFEGNKVERTRACIEYATTIWQAEIDYLKELVAAGVDDAGK